MRSAAALVLAVAVAGGARSARAQDFYPQETESYLINYQVLSKSHSTAYLLSAAPGFGAGHFYAHNTGTGAVMALGQVLGAALFILSPQVLEDNAERTVSITGYLIFTGFKIADMVLAPFSAEAHNIGLAKRLKIKPLAMREPGSRPRLAYGLALEAPLGL